MTFREKQSLFAFLVALLILKARDLGYEVTLGEAWRPPETCALYEQKGVGRKESCHPHRLAIDLNLFKNGKYLDKTEDHRPLGEWWEQQHPLCRWGGRFKRAKDGNHYSLAHGNLA